MANVADVPKLYQSVVDDVINNVREAFLDDGVDEQILVELKQLWESKLIQSKVLQKEKPVPRVVTINPTNPGIVRPTVPAHAQVRPQATAYQAQQLPVMNPNQQGLLEMSSAAQAATIALPAGLYQQQLAALQGGLQGGTITLTQGGQQYIIQTAPGQVLQTHQAGANVSNILPQHAQQQTANQQQQQQQQRQQQAHGMVQLDGPQDSKTQATESDDLQASCSSEATGSVESYALPAPVKSTKKKRSKLSQLDGPQDSSSDDDDDDDDDDDGKDDDDDDDQNDDENDQGEEEEPLNSCDDVSSDEDPAEVFDTENVVVCQFDRINRNKNKWKFALKDGIMNLNGRDYVFQKATGESEW